VVRIEIPPLRERRDDIPLFVDFFSRAFCARSGLPDRRFTAEATALLTAHEWPGNVRELKNIVERLVIMTREDVVTADHVSQTLNPPTPRPEPAGELFGMVDFRAARAAFEREFLRRKLEETEGNVTRTAERVGLERTNLHRKIKSLGLGESGEDS